MKEFYKIEDFIDLDDENFALYGVSQLNGEVYNMASSADVLEEINDNFGERSIYVKETATPFASFAAMWARWITRRAPQLASAYQVLVTEYNPLENYNRTETHDIDGTFVHGEKITKSYSHTGTDNTTITPAETTVTTTPETETTVTITPAETTRTITPAGTTNTLTPAETTETTVGGVATGATVSQKADASIYAFNSSTPVKISEGTTTDSSKQTKQIESDTAGTEVLTVDSAGSEVETTQTAGSQVTSYDGSDTVKTEVDAAGSNNRSLNLSDSGSDTHSGTDTTTEDREIHAYGNIGTMSTQNMAQQELDLRKRDFVYDAILEFINLYTVYA